MLILSRKLDEDIVIRTPEGRTIVIKVVRLQPDKVRLGFTAGTDVKIDRRELLTQKEPFRGLERPLTDGPLPTT